MDKKIKQEKRDPHFKVKTNNNGSMARDLDEIERLGKEMDQSKTQTELKEEKLTQDPKQ